MGLDLHLECLSRLYQFVAEHLPGVRIDHDMFLQYSSMAPLFSIDKILPGSKILTESLQRYVGEHALYTFLSDSIARDIYETNQYSVEKKGVPLVSFPNYSIPADAAKRLIDDFNTLPWNFRVSLEIPKPFGNTLRNLVGNFNLSDSFRLVCPDDKYSQTIPLKSGIEQRDSLLFGVTTLLTQGSEQEACWSQETAYLQTDVTGFIGFFQDTAALEDAIAQLKGFFGLGIAVRLLKLKEEVAPLPLFGPPSPMKYHLLVHRDMNSHAEIWLKPELPPEFSEVLGQLDIEDFKEQLGTPMQNSNSQSAIVKAGLSTISAAFRKPDQAARVLLAAQWLIDSYTGRNDLLSYVQAAVAMEILLGEEAKSDIIGIGELMRNRCAYLIGASRSHRERILGDFIRIYDVRSKIVHRGKSRLTLEERGLFQELRWMCGRVIQEELRLLSNDTS